MRFALIVRCLALVVIALWLIYSVPFPRVSYWLGLELLFLASGVVPYVMQHRKNWRLWYAGFAFLDATVLVTAMLLPNPIQPGDWPLHMGFRFHNVLYLFLLLAGAALSYSPFLVLWTGAAAAATWSAAVLLIASRPETITEFPAPTGDAALDSRTQLEIFMEPTYLSLQGWLNEVVLLMVTAAVIAAAVWRGRRLMLRQASSERARANLSRYVAPDLVDRLARDQAPLATSEERRAAVLFVDIVGFTRFAEGKKPEQSIALLRSFHRRMARCVFACGGSVDKYAGDSVMAIFGALGGGEDHAGSALRCARAMLAEIAAWNAKRGARNASPVKIGIGIHYGPVVVGNVGEERLLQFTAIGDTVNVAARLESLTREHGAPVLASAETVEAARREGNGAAATLNGFAPAGTVQLRGRHGEIELWRLSGNPEAAKISPHPGSLSR